MSKSLLSASQRNFVRADTQIDRLIIDRATDAFDALLRGDVDGYKRYMEVAYVQMGYERPIRPQDRPTALDVIKTILIRAYADREHISFRRAAAKLKEMQQR